MLSRRLILLGVVVALAGCGTATGQGGSPSSTTVAATFASPPQWPGHAGKRDGHEVPASEIVAAAGPLHCGWQSATFLTVGWPLGTQVQTADHARQYIRDPNGVVGQTLHAHLGYHASLPADAKATGYWYGPVQLFVSPSDADRAVYLVAGQSAERWPRSDPMTACS
jgi:hypothetical protein